jgi:hypothetical protein
MSKRTNANSTLIKIMAESIGQKPVAFNRIFASIGGSAVSGLFMSQLYFWYGKGKDGWIYKTIDEFFEETALTRREQDTAIKRWKELGVLEVKIMGMPARRHFKVDIVRLMCLVSEYSGVKINV